MLYRGYVCGEMEQAITGLEADQSRDPLSAYLASILAQMYAMSSRESEARRWVDAATELSPDSFVALWARQLLRRFPGAQWLIALPDHRRLVSALGLPAVPVPAE